MFTAWRLLVQVQCGPPLARLVCRTPPGIIPARSAAPDRGPPAHGSPSRDPAPFSRRSRPKFVRHFRKVDEVNAPRLRCRTPPGIFPARSTALDCGLPELTVVPLAIHRHPWRRSRPRFVRHFCKENLRVVCDSVSQLGISDGGHSGLTVFLVAVRPPSLRLARSRFVRHFCEVNLQVVCDSVSRGCRDLWGGFQYDMGAGSQVA